MTRIEHIGEQTLILGDCREVMPTLGRFDACVTDPPYGVGFKYDIHIDNQESYDGGYGSWLWSILESAENLCNDGSPFFVWQTSLNIRNFSHWFPRNWRLFVAAKNFVQIRPTAMQFSYDPVIVWWKDNIKPWSLGTASRDFHIANTAPIIATPNNIERQHPCPRPLDQIKHIIEQWVKPEAEVLDPFMGSGTTLVACQQLGRKGTGIEISEKYFDIACKRVEQAAAQPRLFNEPKQKTIPTPSFKSPIFISLFPNKNLILLSSMRCCITLKNH